MFNTCLTPLLLQWHGDKTTYYVSSETLNSTCSLTDIVNCATHVQRSMVWTCLDWPTKSSSFCWNGSMALRTVGCINVSINRCQWQCRQWRSQNVYRLLLLRSLFLLTLVLVCFVCPLRLMWAVMIIWRITGKIIRTVLCCIVYHSCIQLYAHPVTHMSSSYRWSLLV